MTDSPIGPKPKRGRPKPGTTFIPTKEQRSVVQALAAVGIDQPAIAKYMSIGLSTLKRHFKVDLRDGRDRIHAAVAGTLVKKALGGHSASIFFLLTRRFQWKEINAHQFVGKDGQPISIDALDDNSLDQLIQSFRVALGTPASRVLEEDTEEQDKED